jgi:pimeloyl-ACP methyl ester carboxylesterase
MTEAQVVRTSGTQVSFRSLGTGKRKILFFHGFPGSSAQIDFFEPYLITNDLEVICLDRPGYNRSHSNSESHAALTVRMNEEIVRKQAWSRFELISVSGGTPYLFAFAQAYPELISRITIVSGLMPVNDPHFQKILSPKLLFALRVLPWVPRFLFQLTLPVSQKKPSEKPATVLRYLMPLADADLAMMRDPRATSLLRQALREAFAQGGFGPKQDAKYYGSRWSTDLPSYRGPVDIWHGKEDQILPFTLSEKLLAKMPQAKLHLIEEEGHYSLAVNQFQNILV